jgi:hypothetical protein
MSRYDEIANKMAEMFGDEDPVDIYKASLVIITTACACMKDDTYERALLVFLTIQVLVDEVLPH